ncbi:MAG: DUF4957 domain-containing protein [Prevotella sp.]|nr:DUF4957 domain-containing protein [Prevotella sp.]
MKQKHVLGTMKLCLLAMASSALLFTSCAQDDFEDETFTSEVRNTQLQSPDAEGITVTPNADGSRQTIAWPLVKGARGFEVKVNNVNDPENIVEVVDSIIDGYSLTFAREEDTNYEMTIRTLANTSLGNRDAVEATPKAFNSFSESYAAIEDGMDIFQYFEENPLPEEPLGKELCFDLAPNGTYTMSGNVNFGGHRVTFRTTSKTEHATINMLSGSTFTTFAGFGLKYVDIDATELDKNLVTLTDTPNDSIKGLIEGSSYYFIMEPIIFQSCNIKALKTAILATNSAKYDIRTVMISDCVVEIPGGTTAFVYTKSGYITDFTAKNSTIYGTERLEKFFIQSGGRPKDVNDTETRSVTISNCTVANIAWTKNFCDYHNGQTTYYYTLLNSIIFDCGKTNLVTGLNKGQDSENPTWNVDNNTFWRNGADASEKQLGDDPSKCKWITNNQGANTVLTTDPEIDPATGDFTPAADQQAAGQGDPRWYTTE